MDREQFFQSILSSLGGAENISRQVWRGSKLCVTVKDVGVLRLNALEDMGTIASVELNCGRVTMSTQGLEKEEEIEMAKKNYDELVAKVIDLIGGKDNIQDFAHCITRLRFNVKDKNKVQAEELKKCQGAVGCNWTGNQFQIIIGQDVGDVYDMICKAHGITAKAVVDAAPDDTPKEKKTVKVLLNNALQHFVACVLPAVPVMMGTGMIKCVLILLNLTGLIAMESGTYQFLYAISDAGLYFLPVYVGILTAKHFGGTDVMGALMGAMLLCPSYTNAENPFTFFGITVPAVTYASTLLPAFLNSLVMCYVEKFFKKHCPKAVRSLLVPMLTAIVMIPIGFVVLGPLGSEIGNMVSAAILQLHSSVGFVVVAILGALYPLLIITGMHYSLLPPIIQAMADGGDYLFCNANLCANVAQGIATLAVGLKSKDPDIRSTGFSTSVTALLGGITEPALYGVSMRFKTPLIAAMIGGAAGGFVMGINNVYKAVPGGGGTIYGMLPTYITENPGNFIWAAAGIATTVVVTFILTYILYKDPKGENA